MELRSVWQGRLSLSRQIAPEEPGNPLTKTVGRPVNHRELEKVTFAS